MTENELDNLMVLTYCKEQGQFHIDSAFAERIHSVEAIKRKNATPNYLFLCVFESEKCPLIYINAFSKILNIKWDERNFRWIEENNQNERQK